MGEGAAWGNGCDEHRRSGDGPRRHGAHRHGAYRMGAGGMPGMGGMGAGLLFNELGYPMRPVSVEDASCTVLYTAAMSSYWTLTVSVLY